MPVLECEADGQPGYKFGDSGHCYTYTSGDEKSRKAAKRKAILQGAAITGGDVSAHLEEDAREFAQTCRVCEQSKSDRAFKVDGRFKNNLAPVCNDCLDDAELSEEDLAAFAEGDPLETVDIEGVEILKAGGPYFGAGSPKEGD